MLAGLLGFLFLKVCPSPWCLSFGAWGQAPEPRGWGLPLALHTPMGARGWDSSRVGGRGRHAQGDLWSPEGPQPTGLGPGGETCSLVLDGRGVRGGRRTAWASYPRDEAESRGLEEPLPQTLQRSSAPAPRRVLSAPQAPPGRTRAGGLASEHCARRGCGAAAWRSSYLGRPMAVSPQGPGGVGGGGPVRAEAQSIPRTLGAQSYYWLSPRGHLRLGLLCGAERNAHRAEGTLAARLGLGGASHRESSELPRWRH